MTWLSGLSQRWRSLWRGGRTARFSSAPRPIDEVIGEMLGVTPGGYTTSAARVSLDTAMQVAAVQRARNELCSIATLPLQLYSGPTVIESSLLRQIDPDVPNVVTLGQTVEDLVMSGVAWWRITSQDFRGFPLTARRVDPGTVTLDPPADRSAANLPSGIDPRSLDKFVWVDGQPVAKSLMIRFDSPNPPLLTACARTIRRALMLDQLAAAYANNPRPLDYFTESDDPGVIPMTDDEVQVFLARWRSGRKRSGTGYIPGAVKHVPISAPSPAELQLVELQKQCTLEIAQGTGIDPEDLGVSVTSRVYFNSVDRSQQKVNRTYAPYMRAIEQRLSMGDVTPRGQSIRFDLTDYLKPAPLDQITYWEGLQRMGVTDAAEIRMWAGLPVAPPADAGTPAPAGTVAARRHPVRTFAMPTQSRHFTLPAGHRFTVDATSRIIAGLAVPWGAVSAPQFGWRYSFAPGSLEWSDVGRVKHLVDHARPIGKALRLEPQPDGLAATMDVQPGAEGDALLSAAQHGTIDGFSVGVSFSENPSDGDVVVDEENSLVTVLRASLHEVSSTALPSFDDARHTSVRASQGGLMYCPLCGRRHPPGMACTVAASLPSGYSDAAPLQGYTLAAPQQTVAAPPYGDTNAAPQHNGVAPTHSYTVAAPGQPVPAPTYNHTGAAPQQTVAAPRQPGQAAAAPATAAVFAQLPAGTTEAQLTAALGQLTANADPAAGPPRAFVDPAHSPVHVQEPDPYRLVFGRKGEQQLRPGTHDFSADLRAYWTGGDTAAGDRALRFVQKAFTDTGDVGALNPPRQRPDMYVDQREYTYPVWDAINKGTLTDITPFVFPKFSSSSGLVGPHTEGIEPTAGTFLATSQTVTPTANSGKAVLTREVWDQGGNPQVSTLIWQQIVRSWYEGLEAAAVAVLNAATPPAIPLTAGGGTSGQTLVSELSKALARLQFVRGGFTMGDAFTQVDLYEALVAATDDAGAPLLPVLSPSNRNGASQARFGAVNLGGVDWLPAWALAATGDVVASSYLFDRAVVHGWASAPQRLTLDMTEVANIYLGVWGYQATAISDVSGVREITYDPTALP